MVAPSYQQSSAAGEQSICPGRILPLPCKPGERQAHLTYVTAYCAKDKYSTRTSSPLFSSFRNSLTHLLEKPPGIRAFHGLCAAIGTFVRASRGRLAAGQAVLLGRALLSRSRKDLAQLRSALLSTELQRWEVPFPWLQEDPGCAGARGCRSEPRLIFSPADTAVQTTEQRLQLPPDVSRRNTVWFGSHPRLQRSLKAFRAIWHPGHTLNSNFAFSFEKVLTCTVTSGSQELCKIICNSENSN